MVLKGTEEERILVMKKKIMALILVATMVLSFTACNHSDNSKQKPVVESREEPAPVREETVAAAPTASDEDVKKNIDIRAVPTLDGLMCVFITNNSDQIVDELSAQVNYKDDNGSTIDTDRDGHDMILPGYTVVSRLDAPDTYGDFEIVSDVELGGNPKYKNHSEKVAVNANQGNDGIIVEITNNSEVTLDEIEYVVVFYLGNDISSVGYPTDISGVSPNETVTEKCSDYGIEYDRFEVYLNQAHTFGA